MSAGCAEAAGAAIAVAASAAARGRRVGLAGGARWGRGGGGGDRRGGERGGEGAADGHGGGSCSCEGVGKRAGRRPEGRRPGAGCAQALMRGRGSVRLRLVRATMPPITSSVIPTPMP